MTIVGEITRGGANPGGRRRIHDHFAVNVPSARPINPVTRTNWEGVGVEPDVTVAAVRALATAHLLALEKQSARVTGPRMKVEVAAAIDAAKKEVTKWVRTRAIRWGASRRAREGFCAKALTWNPEADAAVQRAPDAPILANHGSGWRGSRPRSADGTEGSLDARQRFRTMGFRSVATSA